MLGAGSCIHGEFEARSGGRGHAGVGMGGFGDLLLVPRRRRMMRIGLRW